MSNTRKEGLFHKYDVSRVDGKPIKGGFCVVLEIGDPNTWDALRTWADTVEDDGYEALADDIRYHILIAEEAP